MAENEVTIRVRVRDFASAQLRTTASNADSLKSSASALIGPLAGVGKGLAGMGAAGAAVQSVAGLAAACAQLAPAALLLPGALLAGGAAMATMKLATAGFGEAISAADPAAFAEATKLMGPAAVEAAQAVRGMQPAIDDMKRSVSGAFFEGWAGQLKDLGANVLPILNTGLTGIASSMGEMGRMAVEGMDNPMFKGQLGSILGDTKSMFDNMDTSVSDLLAGFVGLGSVGATYLPALGDGINNVAERFRNWVDAGTADGSIREMIDAALAGFRDLGDIVTNVGSIVGSIFTGMAGDVGSPLESIKQLTGSLASFFSDPATQESLAGLGEMFRGAGEVIRVYLIGALESLRPVIDTLAPLFTTIFDALVLWAPVLTPILLGVGALVLAMQGAAFVMGVWNGLMTAVRIATTLWTGVQWLLNSALLANPIGLIVIGIAALVAGFIWAWQNIEGFRNFWIGAWNLIVGGFNMAKDGIVGGITWIGDRIAGFANWVGSLDIFGALAAGAKHAVNGVIRALNGIIGGVNLVIRGMNMINPFGQIGLIPSIGYLERGGIFGGGLAMVGEKGPELVNLPTGSKVNTAGDSQRMAERMGGGGGGPARIELVVSGNGGLAELLMRMQRTGELQLKVA